MNSDLQVVLEIIELMKKDTIDNTKDQAELNKKLITLDDIRTEIIKGNQELMYKVINNYKK